MTIMNEQQMDACMKKMVDSGMDDAAAKDKCTAMSSEQADIAEPFAGYTDFADCISKNGDKDNPQAFCGALKAKTESIMVALEKRRKYAALGKAMKG